MVSIQNLDLTAWVPVLGLTTRPPVVIRITAGVDLGYLNAPDWLMGRYGEGASLLSAWWATWREASCLPEAESLLGMDLGHPFSQ